MAILFIEKIFCQNIFVGFFFLLRTFFATHTTDSFVLVTRCNFKRFTRSINIRVQISLRFASLHMILRVYIKNNNNNNTWNMCWWKEKCAMTVFSLHRSSQSWVCPSLVYYAWNIQYCIRSNYLN